MQLLPVKRGLAMFLRFSMSWRLVAAGSLAHFFGGASPEPNEELRIVTRTMESVLQSIQTMHKESSCRKFASLNLLNDCVSFDGTNPQELRSTDHVLDNFQQIFAVRLTACSVEEARQRMPSACLHVLREQPQQASLYLPECRDALFHSKTNYWTTFTAEKKNSAVLCRAMRVEKDKDEALHLYKTLASLLGDVNEVMARHNAELSDLFYDLRMNVTQTQQNLTRDSEVSREAMKQQAAATMHDFKTIGYQLQDFLAVLASHKQTISDSYDDAQEQSIALSNSMVQHWKSAVEQLAEDLAVASEKAEFRTQQSLEKAFNQVYEITGSVAEAKAAINVIVSTVDLVNSNLDAPLQKIAHIDEQLIAHSENQEKRFQATEKSIDRLVARVENFVAAITAPFAFLLTWCQSEVPALFAWFCLIAVVAYRALCFLGGRFAAPLACVAALLLVPALMRFGDPVRIAEKIINSHPNFFDGASGFLSPLFVLLTGICVGIVGQRVWRNKFSQHIALPM